jgi:hypothetical protein
MREHGRRVHRVGERPVPLLAPEQQPAEGGEAQVRGVRVGQRQQLLRVQVALLPQARRHEARQEVALEADVVRHERASLEQLAELRRDRLDGGSAGQVGRAQTGQRLHEARQRAARAQRALERRRHLPRGVEQHRTDLDHLGGRIVREPGGLEVHDRERAGSLQEGAQGAPVEPELRRIPFA